MKTKINKIVLQIPGSLSEGEACKEAIQYSMEHICNVEFTFNGKLYEFLFNELICAGTISNT